MIRRLRLAWQRWRNPPRWIDASEIADHIVRDPDCPPGKMYLLDQSPATLEHMAAMKERVADEINKETLRDH